MVRMVSVIGACLVVQPAGLFGATPQKVEPTALNANKRLGYIYVDVCLFLLVITTKIKFMINFS